MVVGSGSAAYSNITARRMSIFTIRHPFSLAAPFALAHRALLLAGLFRMLLLPGHASLPFSSGRAKSRKSRYSFEGNQPGVLPQAVTNVWRTELGTMLTNGFNSTTEISAYFRYLCLLECATNHRLAPSSSPVWPRLPGTLLTTDSFGAAYSDETTVTALILVRGAVWPLTVPRV